MRPVCDLPTDEPGNCNLYSLLSIISQCCKRLIESRGWRRLKTIEDGRGQGLALIGGIVDTSFPRIWAAIMKKQIIVGIVALALVGGGLWFLTRSEPDSGALTLYGNVDIRQVSLAFENNERIAEMYGEEGDKVKAGQVLAVQDTRTLRLQATRAEAAVAVQEQVLLRLQNGVRPEEMLQAKARLEAALADAALAEQDVKRLQSISRDTDGRAISRQDLDRAAARLRVAQAQAKDQGEALPIG